MQSLAWSYKMGITSIHLIIHSVCKAIWDILAPQYLKEPSTRDWERIAQDFYHLYLYLF